MEHALPEPTAEQLRRRKAAEEQYQNVLEGKITDPDQLNPKTTSPEAVLAARQELGRRGLLGTTFRPSGL